MSTDDDDDEDPKVTAMLERMDRGEPPLDAEEAEERRPYERMLARIRDLPLLEPEPDPGWQTRVMRAIAAEACLQCGAPAGSPCVHTPPAANDNDEGA